MEEMEKKREEGEGWRRRGERVKMWEIRPIYRQISISRVTAPTFFKLDHGKHGPGSCMPVVQYNMESLGARVLVGTHKGYDQAPLCCGHERNGYD